MTLPVLRTSRLVLRPLEAQDAAFITNELQNRAIWEWLTVIPQPYTHDDAMEFITQIAPGTAWLIEKDGAPQGVIGVSDELGYWLAQDAWGQGIITEAGDAAVDWWFSDPAHGDLPSSHFAANDRSRRALEKIGFIDTGPKRSFCRSDGRTDIPGREMILTRTRWQDRRAFRLETDRLTLREMTDADAPAFARICGHPQVAPNLFAMTVGWSEEDAARLIAASRYRGRIPFRAAICKDGEMIGTCGVGGIGPRSAPSVMYAIHPDHAGQGYATEAMRAFVDELDRRFAPALLEADHFTDNPASGAVLRNLGFRRTGQGKGHSAARDGAHPVVLFERRTIHTDRLLLRPLSPSDTERMHSFMADWNVARQTGSWPWPADRSFTANRCQTFEGEGDLWAICHDGDMVGTIGITRKDSEIPTIGYQMGAQWHGQGFVTEAARAAIAHAASHHRWSEIGATTWHDNPASDAVLRKLGFVQTGTSTAFATARGEDTTCRRYRLTIPSAP